jgi:SWIM zinc finger
MTTKTDKPGFDAETLRAMAGDKAFARGQSYFSAGQVEILAIERSRIRARVAGTVVYRTELKGSGRRFSGDCTCPAASDRADFCKHLVAVALCVNAMKPGAAAAIPNRFEKTRDHLRAQKPAALVEMIIEMTERDAGLLRDLELAVAMDGKDEDMLLAGFRQAVTDATRISDYVEYGEMRDWAANVKGVLKRVDELFERGHPLLVLRLLDHFFDRMEKALQDVDDSDGHGGGLVALASDLHLKACRAAKPEPFGLARELFRRETEWDWSDCFHDASGTYRALLGNAGLAEYRRLAEEAWAGIKPLHGGARRMRDDQFALRYRLQFILEDLAARDGDIGGMIAIRARDLSSAYRYLQVAKLCADHGRTAEALKWADEGLWQFEDEPDKRLVAFACGLRGLLSKTGDPSIASPKAATAAAAGRRRRTGKGGAKSV